MSDRFDLKGRTALVTGGGRGLGWNMSRALAEAGANLVLAGRNAETLATAAKKLTEEWPIEVHCIPTDLNRREETASLAREALGLAGKVDILIHNAAATHQNTVDAMIDEVWDQMHETNLGAAMVLTRALVPGMKERGWGRLLYITSAVADVSLPVGHSAYSSSKSALHAYARTAAVELGTYGVTANCVALGTFVSDMSAQGSEATGTADTAATWSALERWGQPEEVEGAILLLAGEAGSYITGSVLRVDGGLTCRLA